MKQLESTQEIKASEKLILRILHREGGMSKAELALRIGASVSTVGRLLDRMHEAGILAQTQGSLPSAGRRPALYEITGSAYYALGAFVDWNGIGIGLMNAKGEILSQAERSMNPGETPEEVARYFREQIQALTDSAGLDTERVRGLGVAVPGPLLKRKGILFHSHHLPWPQWDTTPIRDIVTMQTGWETWVDNLANTALRSEVLQGVGKNESRPAYLLLDIGIGSATYLAGMTGFSEDDTSGSLGHMIISLDGEKCVCGNYGCLETFAAVDSVIRRFERFLKDRQSGSSIKVPPITERSKYLRAIRAAIETPDLPTDEFEVELVDALAVGINNFLNLTRPTIVMFGGRLPEELPSIVDKAFEKARRLSYLGLFEELRFVHRPFTDELLIRGAAYHVLDSRLGLTNPSTM